MKASKKGDYWKKHQQKKKKTDKWMSFFAKITFDKKSEELNILFSKKQQPQS